MVTCKIVIRALYYYKLVYTYLKKYFLQEMTYMKGGLQNNWPLSFVSGGRAFICKRF